ncbi:MAG: hypothetical protein ACODAA_04130 [Gemmatimonadota bacterium]
MRAAERRARFRTVWAATLLAAVAACGGRTTTPATDADPVDPTPSGAELTEEDFYGTYDLFMGGAPYEAEEAAPLTVEWGPSGFVVLQDGTPTLRTDISIDPGAGEIRLWDETTSDLLCSSEGIYSYEDDGTTMTLALESDPCENRAASADGARLVRR